MTPKTREEDEDQSVFDFLQDSMVILGHRHYAVAGRLI